MANQKPRVLRKKLKMSIKVEGKRNSQVETSISFTLYLREHCHNVFVLYIIYLVTQDST